MVQLASQREADLGRFRCSRCQDAQLRRQCIIAFRRRRGLYQGLNRTRPTAHASLLGAARLHLESFGQ